MNVRANSFFLNSVLSAAALIAAQHAAPRLVEAHGDHRFHTHPGQEEPEPIHQPGFGWPGYVPGSTSAYGPATGVGVAAYGGKEGVSVGLYVPLNLGPAHQTRQAWLYPQTGDAPGHRGHVPVVDYNCLEVREYQTEIVIDGDTVPAHGDACLQADGSWRVLSGPFTE